MARQVYADNVDANGKVFDTVGENIRKGARAGELLNYEEILEKINAIDPDISSLQSDVTENKSGIKKNSDDIYLLKEDLSNVDDFVKMQIVIPTKKRTLNSYTGYSEEIAKVHENERWIVAFSEYSNKISIINLKSSWIDISDVMNQDNNTCEINITANGSLRVNNEGTSYTGSYIAFNTTGNDKLHTFIMNNGINSNAELYNVNQYIENYLLKNEQNVSEGYITSIDPLTNSNLFVEHAILSSGSVVLRAYNDTTLKKYRFDVNKQKKYVVVIDVYIKNDSGFTIGSFYTAGGLQIRYSTGNVALNCDVLDTNGYYREGSTANFEYSIPNGTTKNVRIIGKFSAENLELTSVYWNISLNRFKESGSSTNIVSGITSKVLNCWVFEDTGYSNYELENYVGKRILSEDVIVKNVEHAIYSDKIKTIFEGKKVVTYGDSITANGGWQDYLRTYFDCTIVNKGIGGTTVANNGAENYFCLQSRIDTIPQDADVVIIMGGTNDSGDSIPLGDLIYNEGFDTTKFKGGLATTIRMIQTRCPNAMIFVASPCSGRGTSGQNMDTVTFNNIGLTTYDYAKACKEVAEYFSTPYIPIFEECGINPWNRKEYIADSVHVNDLGKMQIAMVFIKYLKMYGNIN